jgi:hypothetical protein
MFNPEYIFSVFPSSIAQDKSLKFSLSVVFNYRT